MATGSPSYLLTSEAVAEGPPDFAAALRDAAGLGGLESEGVAA